METKFKIGERVRHIDGEIAVVQSIGPVYKEQSYYLSGLKDEMERKIPYDAMALESRLKSIFKS